MLIGTKPEYLLVFPPLMFALKIRTSAELCLRLIGGSSLLQVYVGISSITLWAYVVPLSKGALWTVFFYHFSQMLQRLGASCCRSIGKVNRLPRHRVSKF